MFSKKDMKEKQIQLILYALALQQKYPNKKIRNLYFDMLKYSDNKGELVERIKYNIGGKGLKKICFNELNIAMAKMFVIKRYREINSLDKNNIGCWEKNINNFFCNNLCSNYEVCTMEV